VPVGSSFRVSSQRPALALQVGLESFRALCRLFKLGFGLSVWGVGGLLEGSHTAPKKNGVGSGGGFGAVLCTSRGSGHRFFGNVATVTVRFCWVFLVGLEKSVFPFSRVGGSTRRGGEVWGGGVLGGVGVVGA